MRIYFLGICGTAMGNVAVMLKSIGHDVSGCDNAVYPPMSDVLQAADIQVFSGYEEARISRLNPDLIVVGNVMSRGNPEIEFLLDNPSFNYCSLPELLHSQILKARSNIVVTGTHGKTTTTSIAAHILFQQNLDPGYLIGGIPRSLPTGSTVGNPSSPFVIEGDEYDSAFFDKRSKFIHYNPKVLIMNNLEFDHADIFRDLEDIQRTFSHVLKLVPPSGFALINGDDQNLLDLLPAPWTNVIQVGTAKHNDLRLVDYQEDTDGSSFALFWKNREWARINWSLSGLFNARNAAMAALATALIQQPNNVEAFDLSAINSFSGVKRRQEIRYEDSQLVVIEDFAHHPTAVAQILEALKARYPNHHISAAFEPRSYTSCRAFHQETLRNALTFADSVYMGAVHRKDAYADPLDTKKLAKELSGRGTPAQAFNDSNELLAQLNTNINADDDRKIIVFLSNGSFDGIIDELLLSFDKSSLLV